jgi:Tfp pilus assembly protein PilX
MISVVSKVRQTAKQFGVRSQRGYILVGVLVIGLTLTVIGIGVMSFTSSTYGLAVKSTYAANAALVAEAGIERSLHELNASSTFPGYSTEQTFFDDATQGKGVYTTVVADTVDTNAKTITATGKVYRYGTSRVEQTRKVRVTVVGTASPGHSVHTGPGGLILSGSANITNSNVYVNGYIAMNGAARIGTSAQPSTVNVANYRCPMGANPGATFASQCPGTGGSANPISLQHSTYIYGTVCATGQTSTGPNNNIQPGSTGAGLQVGCTAPVVSTPTYDRAAHIAAVATTGAGNSNTYVCNSWPFDRTWPANLRLTGNVSVAGSCNIVVTGDVYITGNLNLGGASTITIADSVGADRPNIIVDGTITLGGSARILANNQGTGAHFISFRSSASCNPNCTNLTGNDLYNSMGTTTVTVGGAVNLPGMIFQSYWGRIVLTGSGNLGAAIGQTVDMSGAGTVLFGTTLSSGTTSWSVTGYQRLFN